MRFLRKNKYKKIVLVISDLHLGAGNIIRGRRNYLEDFHFDRELVEFLEYYSHGDFATKEVEIVINGDFLDFLAVPYVDFFDDEFWSEKSSLKKLEIIIEAHREVFEAIDRFLSKKNKRITYIIGNHDAEMVFPSLQEYLRDIFSEENREQFVILNDCEIYRPLPGVAIKHGHQYEYAHNFSLQNSLIRSTNGDLYFLPPWGSYYVTRVINKFKEERTHINEVRPIKNFLIYGLVFDTLLTLRFMFANAYYFFVVHFFSYIKDNTNFSIRAFIKKLSEELELFHDLETITQEYFSENPEDQVLVVGHTHDPAFRELTNGKFFINTGSWTKMVNLDFRKFSSGVQLTYAEFKQKEIKELSSPKNILESIDFDLNIWQGKREYPYSSFL